MKKLIINITVGILIIAIPSFTVQYWYSHNHDIYIKSLKIIKSDESVTRVIGTNIKDPFFVYIRISRRGTGETEYKIKGSKGEAIAKVSSFKESDTWHFRWIWLKLENGKYHVVLDNRKLKRSKKQGNK